VGDLAREPAAVAEQPPVVDGRHGQAERVLPLGTALHLPFGALHQSLGGVAEDALVAVEVGGGPRRDVTGGGHEAGGRGQRAGADVVDRHPPTVEDERTVSRGQNHVVGHPVEVGHRRPEIERAEQVLGDMVGVGLPADGFDHETEQPVGDVGVLEPLVGREHLGVVSGDRQQPGPIREQPGELPEVAVPTVAHEAAAVGEQLPNGPCPDPGLVDVGDDVGEAVVEAQPAVLDEAHHGGRRERLRV
jgi:hypothetical protein